MHMEFHIVPFVPCNNICPHIGDVVVNIDLFCFIFLYWSGVAARICSSGGGQRFPPTGMERMATQSLDKGAGLPEGSGKQNFGSSL